MTDASLVLALRASGLGDLLTVVPALRGLGRAWPDADVVVAAPGPLGSLLVATGVADGVVPTHGLTEPIAAPGPIELAVNLHGSGPESHRRVLETAPRHFLAFRHERVPESVAMPRWIAGEHDVHRWCRLLTEMGIPADPTDLELTLPEGHRSPLPSTGGVVVHPGAGSPARRWPLDRWATVAAGLAADGHRVIVTGTGGERRDALTVAASAGLSERCVVAGRTDVVALAALVADADLVVCGDTGVGHLATALGTSAVHVFGPVPPAEWGPPEGLAGHRVLWSGTTGDPHGTSLDPGLERITTADVLGAARELVGAVPPLPERGRNGRRDARCSAPFG